MVSNGSSRIDGSLKFNESYVQTFMGGEFEFEKVETVGQLIDQFQGVIDELRGWSNAKVGEVWFKGDKICVTLSEGIVQ